jgi:hypothetical protein
MTFHIIIAGLYPVGPGLISAMMQNCNKKIWAVWDDSPFNEKTELNGVFNWYRSGRHYKSKNHFELIRDYVLTCADDDDVLVFLDGDDKLIRRDALGPVEAAYKRDRKLLLTYGSYKYKSNGKRGSFNGEYRNKRPFRMSQWHATHLKTVKVKLWKHLPESVLKNKEGGWMKTAEDVAIMLALMEMAGRDRIKHIPQEIYEYNDENPLNVHKETPGLQIATDKWIRSLPAFERIPVI